MCDHISFGTNGGALRPAITVFRPRQPNKSDLRVWNGMGIAYAGYIKTSTDNKGQSKEIKIGDQGNLEFTQFCQRLGWTSQMGQFDVLPLVLSDDEGVPKFYNIPKELILKVPIQHPSIKAINDMKLEWYALPFVTGLMLEVGGIEFPAAPFAGWYTSVEIGTRDLLEPNRFGLQEKIGQLLGLDTGSLASLWKDKVALEMNMAVLHSFAQVGATIVDQHTVSEQFQMHYKEELKTRGGCPSDWVWLTPSQSGSLTPLYHQEMLHYNLSPCLDRQPLPWETYRFPDEGEKKLFKFKSVAIAVRLAVVLYRKKKASRPLVKIFFATETGTAKKYVKRITDSFAHLFNVQVIQMDQYKEQDLSGYCLFITSTFGNGDPPGMASKMAAWIDSKLTKTEESKSPFKRKATIRRSKKGTLNQRMSLQIKEDFQKLR